jgi:hypothetical protein
MANPFHAAQAHLWNGLNGIGKKEKYSCHAIQRAADRGAISQADADQAQAMIHTRLGEYPTVNSWLCCEAGIRLGEMSHERVQSYRVLWLEELSSIWNQGERT